MNRASVWCKFSTRADCWLKVHRSCINLFAFNLSPSRGNLCAPSKLHVVAASGNGQVACDS